VVEEGKGSDSCIANEEVYMSTLQSDLVDCVLEISLGGYITDDGMDI
jgi:hypothetical protein